MDWPRSAEELLSVIAPERLHATAVLAADASAARNESWLVAFSGGADSLALLLLLWARWPSQRSRLTAAHFNHTLRGDESDGDERFCRDVCAGLGIGFTSGRWDQRPDDPSEDDARRARYAFFDQVRSATGARLLFTGHQLDDIAETQLMRLARGSSAAGLAAPRPVRGWVGEGTSVVRPLLTLSKAELKEALRTAGVPWREDATNAEGHFFRNRVRNTVVPPWLQAAGPNALEGAALTRMWMEEDDAALEAWLDVLGVPAEPENLDLAALAGKPRALLRRALRRWRPAAELSRGGFDELLTRAEAGTDSRMSLGDGFAEIAGGKLRWVPAAEPMGPWSSAHLRPGATLALPDGAELRAAVIPVTRELRERFAAGQVDCWREAYVAEREPDFLVRPWQPGDRFRPLGAPGSQKLQDVFVNRKVPAAIRAKIPVICGAGGRIVWVPGVPPAEESKLTDASVTAVQLTYLPGTSTVTHYS